MGDVVVPMTLPLDSDGYLRRECPHCERQFKWLPNPVDSSETSDATPPEHYFCPYCHEPAGLDAWWTKAQLEHVRALMMAEVVEPQLEKFKRDLRSLDRPGSLFRFDVDTTIPPDPDPLSEADDMVRLDLPCHPDEPVKVDEAWTGEVACLMCGIRYPVDLVRALP